MTSNPPLRQNLGYDISNPLLALLAENDGYSGFQTQFPLLRALFNIRNPGNVRQSIQLGTTSVTILDADENTITIRGNGGGRSTVHQYFVKAIPILNPLDYIHDDQHQPDGSLNSVGREKIGTYYNEAQVETLFTQLLQNISGFPRLQCHFTATKKDFPFDISMEYDSFVRDTWWRRQQRRQIFRPIPSDREAGNYCRISPTPPRNTDVETANLGEINEDGTAVPFAAEIVDLPEVVAEEAAGILEEVSFDDVEDEESDSGSDGSESGSETGSESGSDGSESMQIVIPQVPVQGLVLERIEHKVDDLLMAEPPLPEDHWRSIMFQVIGTLYEAQRDFSFTHNDLHTNNLMWEPTSAKQFMQTIEGVRQRVPTQGRKVQIIDFGRAIMKVRDRWIVPDAQKQPNGQAAGMQNFGPQRSDKVCADEVLPNMSVDMARLATSMVDCLCPGFNGGGRQRGLANLLREIVTQTDETGEPGNFMQSMSGDALSGDFAVQMKLARYASGADPVTLSRHPFFSGFQKI